ncbi:MAG: NAD(P)/FAD-dependent oxidoreductase [Marmoricola sp.]
MSRARVLVVGLGDTGVLTAIHLAGRVDVVGVATKPGLLSGQELGLRLAWPERWQRDYRISFRRFRRLDGVRVVHGEAVGVDLEARRVDVRAADGAVREERYDVLVIATGVSNGFWRTPAVEADTDVEARLQHAHRRLDAAGSIAVLGGGPAAVSSAAQLAGRWPATRVDLYFPGDRALPAHHAGTWERVEHRLRRLGVGLHPRHRAVVPDDFACDRITAAPVHWSTGQEPVVADAVLWTIGRVRPHTGWLPDSVLDEDGFVRVDAALRVVGAPGVFAIGDVAATDPLRSSARNRADRLLARNVLAHLTGRPPRAYRPPTRRWGSVLGPQADGLQVFTPRGRAFRFPGWSLDTVLQPLIVRWGIYGGVRRR